LLQGAESEIGLESTVIECTGVLPVVLRSGSISIEQLQEVIPEITRLSCNNPEAPRSPGLKHRHYSPHAKVIIASSGGDVANAAFIGLHRPEMAFRHQRICSDINEYGRTIYEFFRECDRLAIETIYCEPVEETGLGFALMDRLKRAAESDL
jgi:L-threonylcarbamoyladenylate synthase